MGEARRKSLNGGGGVIYDPSGIAMRTPFVPDPESTPKGAIRVVSNLRLQNIDQDGVTVLMMGAALPELAVMLTPEQSRELIEALQAHVDNLEHHMARPPDETGESHGR